MKTQRLLRHFAGREAKYGARCENKTKERKEKKTLQDVWERDENVVNLSLGKFECYVQFKLQAQKKKRIVNTLMPFITWTNNGS